MISIRSACLNAYSGQINLITIAIFFENYGQLIHFTTKIIERETFKQCPVSFDLGPNVLSCSKQLEKRTLYVYCSAPLR